MSMFKHANQLFPRDKVVKTTKTASGAGEVLDVDASQELAKIDWGGGHSTWEKLDDLVKVP